jgi:hypothetical protein
LSKKIDQEREKKYLTVEGVDVQVEPILSENQYQEKGFDKRFWSYNVYLTRIVPLTMELFKQKVMLRNQGLDTQKITMENVILQLDILIEELEVRHPEQLSNLGMLRAIRNLFRRRMEKGEN